MNPEEAVDLAIENVIYEGLDDVFDRPPELDFLNDSAFRHAVSDIAKRAIVSGSIDTIGPIQHTNVPKSGMYAFRRCAIVQPMDHIKYLALTLLVAEAIESARIPVAENRIFSYRLEPAEGRLFSPKFSFASFHECARRRAAEKSVKVVIKCDIANFYDRLNLHRLESTLLTTNAEPKAVGALNGLLLYWAKKDSYGLPVGSNASRILAEAALIEIDRYLVSLGVDFIRFVDDYQFFAPDMSKAQFWLYKMMDRLAQEGLGLNAYKTRVFESKSVGYIRTAADDVAGGLVKFKPVRPVQIGPNGGDPDGRGFYLRIPRRFILPDTGENTTRPRHAAEICAGLLMKTVVELPEFRELTSSLLTFGEFSVLTMLPNILRKHPPYIDYAMGMLAHFKDSVPAPIRDNLSLELGDFLCSPQVEMPEWHKIKIVGLLGVSQYANRDALLTLLRNMPRHYGAALGRAVLDSLGNFASRGDALEIKELFERSDPAERRAILRILNKVLPDDEKRAWCKYAGQQCRDDPFAVHFVRPYKAKSS